MKKIAKIFLLVLVASVLVFTLAMTVSAEEKTTNETIVVGISDAISKIDEAWAAAAASATPVEVVVEVNNDNFDTVYNKVYKQAKATTLQLVGDVTTTVQYLKNVAGTKITIDVSGYTFEIGNRFQIAGDGSELTIRTSTDAGTLITSNTGSNEALFTAFEEGQNGVLNLISANNTDKRLTVEFKNNLITMGSKTAGVTNINFLGGAYEEQGTKGAIRANARSTSAPSTLKITAKDATFTLTTGFIAHNDGNTYDKNDTTKVGGNIGAFSMDSYMAFDGCEFIGVENKDVHFASVQAATSKTDRFIGRYFGTIDFSDCSFDNIYLNFEKFYTYCTKNEDGTYNSNYPLYVDGVLTNGKVPENGNCVVDYRPTAAAAGYDGTKQISFHGRNVFFGDTQLTNYVDSDGFKNAPNVNLTECYYNYDPENKTLTIADTIRSTEEFYEFINYANASKKAVKAFLAADVELDCISGKKYACIVEASSDFSIDLKGHTLSFVDTAGTASQGSVVVQGNLHIYSSEAGAKIKCTNSTVGAFFLNGSQDTTVILGRKEDPRENLSIEVQKAIFCFGTSFQAPKAVLGVYSATVTTEDQITKLNSLATQEVRPVAEISLKNCDITLADKGILTYNETETLDADSTSKANGIFAYGSFLNVEDCSVRCKGDSNNLFTSKDRPRVENGKKIPTFRGRYYGTVSFKNTHFENITLNFNHIYSDAENQALNGVNDQYKIPAEWDVQKQITFYEGCTFTNVSGMNANGFSQKDNVTLANDLHIRKTSANGSSYALSKYGFISSYLNLANDLNMVYRVFLPAGTDATVTFSIDGFEKTVEAFGQDENGLYLFKLAGITPAKMNENIVASLSADSINATMNYTIKAYLDTLLEKYATDEALCEHVNSLLVYGAAAQQYVGQSEDSFVTEIGELSAIPSFTVTKNGTASADYSIVGAGLRLDGAFDFGVQIKAASIQGITLVITTGEGSVEVALSSANKVGDYYVVYFNELMATELSDEITFTLQKNGEQIGKSLTMSANAYLYNASNGSDANLATLAKALYAYGAAAKAYQG